jgi:hypothetical protein
VYVAPFHQRVIAGTASTLSWSQIGGDGEPVDPGTVTITVTRADGTAVATAQATSGAGTAARTYALTAAQTATLDRLTATWTASGVTLARTEVDVVAAPWFSNAELRATHPSLRTVDTYTAALISAARLYVESMIERVTNRRFSLGYDLCMIPGVTGYDLVLPVVNVRTVRSAALYSDPSATPSETLGATELAAIPAAAHGVITRYSGTWNATWVKVGVEHGYSVPPPDIKRAAMRLCKDVLEDAKSVMPDQAATWNSTDFGWSATFVTPGVRGNHTSIPWVNEILDAWTFEEVGIA